MLRLRDSLEIAADPEALFDWFAHLPQHYRAWHPDHVTCRFEGPEALRPGTRLYAEEYLHGKLHRLLLKVTHVVPSSRIDYRIAPGMEGTFVFERVPTGTKFTAEIRVGLRWPVVGNLLDRLMMAILSDSIAAVKQHMKEEGANLKRLIEAAQPAAD